MLGLFCYNVLMLTIITPAIDILIFALIMYGIAYWVYIRLYKKDFAGVVSADFKVSLFLLILVIAYYANTGTQVHIMGFSMHWLPYYLILSGLVEIIYFVLYKKATGITWKQIGGQK